MIILVEDIYLNKQFKDKYEAIEFVGNCMIEKGYINNLYKEGMFIRDQKASVAIGNYLAIPHCERTADIFKESIIFVKLKEELQWDSMLVKFVIGLAIKETNQIDVLQDIAYLFAVESTVIDFYNKCQTKEDVIKYLQEK